MSSTNPSQRRISEHVQDLESELERLRERENLLVAENERQAADIGRSMGVNGVNIAEANAVNIAEANGVNIAEANGWGDMSANQRDEIRCPECLTHNPPGTENCLSCRHLFSEGA